jgi:phosphatidate cytidylyltransferase
MEKSNKLFSKESLSRLISAAILVPIILFLVTYHTYSLVLLILILSVLMSMEWSLLIEKVQHKKEKWRLGGVFLVIIPCWSMIWLAYQENGSALIVAIMVIIWATDIGGYIFGKSLKGPKLAPKISPNKRISGFVGGIILACLVGMFNSEVNIWGIIIISILAQLSDLLESIIKRILNVKDSGNLLPGHGGILDAVDGFILVAPCVALYKFFM